MDPTQTSSEDRGRGFWRATRKAVAGLIRANRRTIVIVVAAIAFIALLLEVLEGELTQLDGFAYWLLVVKARRAWLTPVMEGFSTLASPAVVIVMTVIVAAFAPGRQPGRCVAFNLAGALVLNQALKFIVQRPRPDGFRLVSEIGYSFPSGHSMMSMAFYGLLIWLIWKYERDPLERRVWCLILGFVIVMVGVSRVYLGVHYASDVLAGFCVSLLWLAFYTRAVAPAFIGEPESR